MKEFALRFLKTIDDYRILVEQSEYAFVLYAVILVFGILNCILGYRLVRFWMMLAGFAGGAMLGYLAAGAAGIQDEKTALAAAILAGAAIAALSFLVYRAGLFLAGATLAATIAVILIHPRTSAVFFLCLLIGFGFGILILRFTREVLIVITSLFGGIVSGLSLAKLLKMPGWTYGLLFSALFVIFSLIIQFLTNKPERGEETDWTE